MSTRAMVWAFHQKPKDPLEKFVLVVAADAASDLDWNGSAYLAPHSIAWVAKRTGIPSLKVRSLVDSLCEQGLLRRDTVDLLGGPVWVVEYEEEAA